MKASVISTGQIRTARSLLTMLVLIGFASAGVAQNTGAVATVQSQVTISSDPPGAAIWVKDGRDYTCADKVTPATIELSFHGSNDSKQLLLARFGYKDENFTVRSADEKVSQKLTLADALGLPPPDTAPEDLKRLNERVNNATNEIIGKDTEAFRCTRVKFQTVDLIKIKSETTERLALHIAARSYQPELRKLRVGNSTSSQERKIKVAQAALEGGAAEMFERFRTVAAKFPEIGDIVVELSYSTRASALGSEDRFFQTYDLKTEYGYDWASHAQTSTITQTTTLNKVRETVVTDEDTTRWVFLSMPVEKIPASHDRKVITDAVVANANITVLKQ